MLSLHLVCTVRYCHTVWCVKL